MVYGLMIVGYERELGDFQLKIAKRWFRRGEETADVEAKLFFYYTAFNALFFYWSLVDGLLVSGKPKISEHRQIENLVGRLGDKAWDRLCREVEQGIVFFQQREPIQKMDERSPADPREGNPTLGEKHRRVLLDPTAESVDRLIALAKVLYIVRCNLCHGSKGILGDDMAVIGQAVPLLRVLTKEAIRYTGAKMSGT